MADVIPCPNCQRKLQVPENLLGQYVQCPSCEAKFRAEIGAQQPSPPPAPSIETPRADPEAVAPRRRREWRDEDDFDDDYDDGPVRRRRRRDLEPHRGTLILVLGILSLVLGGFGLIIGPIAWIMGNNDLAAIRSGRMDPEGEGTTNAGRICGMISTILLGVGFVFLILMTCLCGFGGMFAPGNRGPRRF